MSESQTVPDDFGVSRLLDLTRRDPAQGSITLADADRVDGRHADVRAGERAEQVGHGADAIIAVSCDGFFGRTGCLFGLPRPFVVPFGVPMSFGHETILLVEDEPAIRRLMSAALEHAGYHVQPIRVVDDAQTGIASGNSRAIASCRRSLRVLLPYGRRNLTMTRVLVILIPFLCSPAYAQEAEDIEVLIHDAAQAPLASEPIIKVIVAPGSNQTRPRALVPLYLVYGGLASGEFAATKIARARGAAELNPLLFFNGDPKLQAAVAIGIGAFTIWNAEQQWKSGHRVRAIVTMAIVNGINAAVLWHDVRWLKNHPR